MNDFKRDFHVRVPTPSGYVALFEKKNLPPRKSSATSICLKVARNELFYRLSHS